MLKRYGFIIKSVVAHARQMTKSHHGDELLVANFLEILEATIEGHTAHCEQGHADASIYQEQETSPISHPF